jgi:hypothetical protein
MNDLRKTVEEYQQKLERVISVTNTPVGVLVIGIINNKVVSKQFKNYF